MKMHSETFNNNSGQRKKQKKIDLTSLSISRKQRSLKFEKRFRDRTRKYHMHLDRTETGIISLQQVSRIGNYIFPQNEVEK